MRKERRWQSAALALAASLALVLVGVTQNAAANRLPDFVKDNPWTVLITLVALSAALTSYAARGESNTDEPNKSFALQRLAQLAERSLDRVRKRTWLDEAANHDGGVGAFELNLRVPGTSYGRHAYMAPASTQPGANLRALFDAHLDAVCLVGLGGHGKTHLMHALACTFLEDFREHRAVAHVPVWLDLADWDGSAIDDWLEDALKRESGLRREDTRLLLDEDRVALFLDGLDEVKGSSNRRECAKAIAQFREEHGLVPLMVTTRPSEGGPEELLPLTPIEVLPLSIEGVRVALEGQGPNGAAIRALVTGDPQLLDLLRTPLYLALACATTGANLFEHVGASARVDQDERRRALIEGFVQDVLLARASATYSASMVRESLCWIAGVMRRENLSFYSGVAPATTYADPRLDVTAKRQYVGLFLCASVISGGLGYLIGGVLWGTVLMLVAAPVVPLARRLRVVEDRLLREPVADTDIEWSWHQLVLRRRKVIRELGALVAVMAVLLVAYIRFRAGIQEDARLGLDRFAASGATLIAAVAVVQIAVRVCAVEVPDVDDLLEDDGPDYFSSRVWPSLTDLPFGLLVAGITLPFTMLTTISAAFMARLQPAADQTTTGMPRVPAVHVRFAINFVELWQRVIVGPFQDAPLGIWFPSVHWALVWSSVIGCLAVALINIWASASMVSVGNLERLQRLHSPLKQDAQGLLDYCVALSLLTRNGSRYRFRHPHILDFFAVSESRAKAVAAGSSGVQP